MTLSSYYLRLNSWIQFSWNNSNVQSMGNNEKDCQNAQNYKAKKSLNYDFILVLPLRIGKAI